MIRAAVFQIVTCYRGDDDVLQIHPAYRIGYPLWFVVFQGERFRCRHSAKAACACAPIARDHKSGRPLAPAFPTIRALRALADRMQPQIRDQRFGRKENRIRRQSHFDPGRLLRLVHGWIDLHAGHFEQKLQR